MLEFIFKIWYMIAILPFVIFIEGSHWLTDFLKRRKIYMHWDIWHSFLVVALVLLILLWARRYYY